MNGNLKFKFYLMPYREPVKAGYHHCSIALAEGFKELGVEFYGNIDQWNPTGEYLIQKAPEGFKHEVAIYSDDYLLENREKIEQLLDPNVFNIFINSTGFPWMRDLTKLKKAADMQEVIDNPAFSRFDLILRSHSTSLFNYPQTSLPWAFGLSNRIIETSKKYEHLPVKKQVAMNFRILHDSRKEFISRLSPLIKGTLPIINEITEGLDSKNKTANGDLEQYYWEHTGRRHSEDYYRFINSSLFTYTFGGLVDFPDARRGQWPDIRRGYHRYMRFLKQRSRLEWNIHQHLAIYQHDSWRFWEVMVSNGIPIHMDFESWGLLLPEYPVNGKHYFGVKGMDVKAVADKMLNTSEQELAQIAENGKQWVLEHYAPVPTAKRFLHLLSQRM